MSYKAGGSQRGPHGGGLVLLLPPLSSTCSYEAEGMKERGAGSEDKPVLPPVHQLHPAAVQQVMPALRGTTNAKDCLNGIRKLNQI